MHAARVARLSADLTNADVEAFVVSHPPNIRYLSGLNATAGAAVVFRGRITLVVDARYAAQARHVAAAIPEAEVVLASRTVDEAVVDVLVPQKARRIGIEGAHLTVSRFTTIADLLGSRCGSNGASQLVPLERVVERRRAVKDAGEIATLKQAARRLSSVAGEARTFVVPGVTEREVAADIDGAMRAAGFERPAFETIVASGPNSVMPHARPTSRTLQKGDGVVLDFGGVYDGYCVDLTRTLHLGPAPVAFRRLFDAVAAAHAAAIEAVKPGALAVDIDGAARDVLVRHGLGDAFGHGTGHGLGLEAHEEPRISPHAPSAEAVLPGMVFTIEPGAYVPGIGGVRIEDDVLVREDGAELLTTVPIEL